MSGSERHRFRARTSGMSVMFMGEPPESGEGEFLAHDHEIRSCL